jgi:hypothetical protein
MDRKEAYKILKENRFLKGKKVMIEFRKKDKTKVRIPATKFTFFIEEDIVRKIIRSLK